MQNQLQTISQLLGKIDVEFDLIQIKNFSSTDGSNTTIRLEEISEPPPIYEAPPNYDEVIKIGMDEQIRSKRQTGNRDFQDF